MPGIMLSRGVVLINNRPMVTIKGSSIAEKENILSALPKGVLTASNSSLMRNAESAVSNIPMPKILTGGVNETTLENLDFSKIIGKSKPKNKNKIKLRL